MCVLPKNKTEAENVLQLAFTLSLKNYAQGTIAQRLGSCLSKKMGICSGAEKWVKVLFGLELVFFGGVDLISCALQGIHPIKKYSAVLSFLPLDPGFRKPQFHVPSYNLVQLIPSGITWNF